MAHRPSEPANAGDLQPTAQSVCPETLASSRDQTGTDIFEVLSEADTWRPDPLESEVQCRTLTQRLKDPRELRQLATRLHNTSGDMQIGRQLGQFELIELLGRGGMGQVYKARHLKLGKLQAVKVLHDYRLNDPGASARFQREMKTLGQLQHPNIVAAHHADEADGVPYLVMDYVDGQSLSDLQHEYAQRGEPFPVTLACDLIRQAALGLQYAHSQGVFHRDIKPGNIMLDRDGIVRVLDLGLARLTHTPPTQHPVEPLTVETQVLGTPDFMAPEQLKDSSIVDGRCDVYALGATLYFILSGRVCHPTDSDMTLMGKVVQILSDTPDNISTLRNDLPAELADVIHRCLEKEPERRSLSAGALSERLSAWSTDIATSQGLRQPHNDNNRLPLKHKPHAIEKVTTNLSARRLWTAVIGGLTALAIASFIVFTLTTSSREIVVQFDDGVPVAPLRLQLLDGERPLTIDASGDLPIHLKDGDYAVTLKRNSDQLSPDDSTTAGQHGRTAQLRVQLRGTSVPGSQSSVTNNTSITLMAATDEDLYSLATRKGTTKVVIFENEISAKGIASLTALPDLDTLQIFAHSGVINDHCLRIVSGLTGLKELHLQEIGPASLTPSALSHLANLKNLTFLFFEHHGFAPDTLGGIEALPKLNRLDLRVPHLKDQSVFEDLTHARGPLQLVLYGTPVNNRDIQKIASIPRLMELHLTADRLTADGFTPLSHHRFLVNLLIDGRNAHLWKELPPETVFANIRWLSIAGTEFSGCEFARADVFPVLKRLSLNRMTISRSAAKRLSQLSTIEELTLTNTRISLDAIQPLTNALPRLRHLTLRKHGFAKGDIERLRQQLSIPHFTAD